MVDIIKYITLLYGDGKKNNEDEGFNRSNPQAEICEDKNYPQ